MNNNLTLIRSIRIDATFCLQARDSYYNGKPLILDDMFDKVEVRKQCS